VAGVAIGSVISIVGSAVNGRITRHATEMGIEAEHRQRLWEKQSAAYEETVREVLARQTRREVLTSRGDPGNIGAHPVEEMRKGEEPESVRIRALMLAYASAAVWAAYEEADKANTLFWVALGRLASALGTTQVRAGHESTDTTDSPPAGVDYQGVLAAMYKSREDAVAADQVLFAAINCELSWTSIKARGRDSEAPAPGAG
jgi:hypothetical protein